MRGVALLLLLSASAEAQVPLPEMGVPVRDGVQVLEFTAGGGLLTLPVTVATAGSEPTEVTNASTEIRWVNGMGVTAKLTVETICPGQRFGLSVEIQITSLGSGTVATVQPAVTLLDGMVPTDLLRDIAASDPAREGTGILTYRASATVADGTSAEHGDDHHTITYTLLEQ